MTTTTKNTMKTALREARSTLETDLLLTALREAGGNITRAAAALGVSRRQMQLKLRELGLNDAARGMRTAASASGFCTRCGAARQGGAS